MNNNKISDIRLFFISLIPLITLFIILGFSIISLKLEPQIPLLLSAFVASLVAIFVLGFNWDTLQKGILDSISVAMPAILILFVIGIVIATWIMAGVVPAIIYYGLGILSPKYFLVSILLLSAVIALATGSSWTAVGTIGIALMGIATALNIHLGWTAGAIISGAYFGDKLSPLSDTTNLAPAVSGTDIFTHIKSMLYTTIPSIIIAIIIFLVAGLMLSGQESTNLELISSTKIVLSNIFNIGIFSFIPLILVLTLILMRIPALPALFVSALVGMVFAIAINGFSYEDVLKSMHYGYESDSKTALLESGYVEVLNDDGEISYYIDEEHYAKAASSDLADIDNNADIVTDLGIFDSIDELLTNGGLASMLGTISLIICAMIFGGVMEASGMLEAVVKMILRIVFNYTALVTATIFTAIFVNIVAADQYLSIVLTGKMYQSTYINKFGVKPENLSRVLETGGTLTSPLVPWNTCGATMYGFLGIPAFPVAGEPIGYAAYSVFNIVNVLVEIIASAIGFGVFYSGDKETLKTELSKL